MNVFSRIPTFSCQRIRLKEPSIGNDRIRSVPPIGSDDRSQSSFPMMGSDDGSLGQISLIFSVIRNYQRNRRKESGVGNGRFRSVPSLGFDGRFASSLLMVGSDDRSYRDEAETIFVVRNLSASYRENLSTYLVLPSSERKNSEAENLKSSV